LIRLRASRNWLVASQSRDDTMRRSDRYLGSSSNQGDHCRTSQCKCSRRWTQSISLRNAGWPNRPTQAKQLTFSLSCMVRIAMILPPALDSSTIAGACSGWELVLRASFDGELDAADSLACELHLGRCQHSGETEKVEIDEAEIRAFRHRVVCSRPVLPFRPRESTVSFVDPRIEKLYNIGNRARDG
jgi:hypothetical protein